MYVHSWLQNNRCPCSGGQYVTEREAPLDYRWMQNLFELPSSILGRTAKNCTWCNEKSRFYWADSHAVACALPAHQPPPSSSPSLWQTPEPAWLIWEWGPDILCPFPTCIKLGGNKRATVARDCKVLVMWFATDVQYHVTWSHIEQSWSLLATW